MKTTTTTRSSGRPTTEGIRMIGDLVFLLSLVGTGEGTMVQSILSCLTSRKFKVLSADSAPKS